MRTNNDKLSQWAVSSCTAVLFFWLATAQAQAPATFESTGPDREVTEGSRFDVTFTLKNASARRFIAPDFKNSFRITSGPEEMRGAGFINGQSYSHQTWRYELEAGKPGTYTIGPAIAQTSSQTFRSQPLTIRVVQARAGRAKPSPNAGDNLFVSGELDQEPAWVGQQLHYQIKLYTQVNVNDFEILVFPAFDGFYVNERKRFDTRTQYQTIRGKRYAVRILYEASIYPLETGNLLIGAAQIRLGVDQAGGGLSSFFGGVPVLMQTQPVKLTVKPLPGPAPAGFLGGVGHYDWKVSADKDSLSTDDALTLTVTIEGNGDSRRFANPQFELPASLEGFDPKVREEEEYETGEQFVHSKTLEYVILPKQPGDYTFNPQLTLFDADSNRYYTLQSDKPVRLHVIAGQHYGKNAAPADTLAGPVPLRSPLTAFWEITNSWWLKSPLIWGSLAGLIVLSSAFFFWKKHKRKPATPVDTGPPPPSLKQTRQRFKHAYNLMQNDDARVFYHELLKSLQAYLALQLQIEPGRLNKELMLEKLTELQAPAPVSDALQQVWRTCEQAVFAGQARTADLYATWQQAESAVEELEAYLKRH